MNVHAVRYTHDTSQNIKTCGCDCISSHMSVVYLHSLQTLVLFVDVSDTKQSEIRGLIQSSYKTVNLCVCC